MALYIRVVDKANFKSPILRIHNDDEEFIKVIYKWRDDLLVWAAVPGNKGLPLGVIDAHTAMVDLLRELTAYYVATDLHKTGRIHMTFSLYDNASMTTEKITDIQV
ncbi:MAG TPA: hypothetical protein VI911_07360 [Patescibacteria group bacterium]|nr:hypothetical protein [Patescibacteria group bacterium]